MRVTKLRRRVAWLSLPAACACANPQRTPEQPQTPPRAHVERAPSAAPAAASSHAPPASASTLAAAAPEPSSFLKPAAIPPLWVVSGNPRLLVGDRQIYEWRDTGIVAKPRLLAEASAG